MALKKPSGFSAVPSGQPTAADLGEWGKKYPSVAAFLSDSTWEDGTTREPGTLLLFWEDGLWKGCLHDRTAAMQTFLSALTPSGLLETAEKGLRGDSLEWRKKRPWGSGKGKKGG